MRAAWSITMLLVLGAGTAAAAGTAVLLKLEELLRPEQIAQMEKRRRIVETTAPELTFSFEKVPHYGNVKVWYRVRPVTQDGRIVRRACEHPSAVVYVTLIRRYSELKRHLNDHEFADVLEQIKAVEDKGATVRTIKIRRAVFDVGRGTPADFLKDRDAYYGAGTGEVYFQTWPERFCEPSGRLTAGVVHTTVVRSPLPSDKRAVIEARQFFGYVFPVLDDLLTPAQKKTIDETLADSNVKEGAVTVDVGRIEDVGDATLHYLVTEIKALRRPSALSTTVTLRPTDLRDDPLIARKYLAPEGAKHLLKTIREGESKTRRLKSVEIRKLYVDLNDETTAEGKSAVATFKKDVDRWCTRDGLVLPEKWPAEFRKPDGTFDIELTFTRLVWRRQKGE